MFFILCRKSFESQLLCGVFRNVNKTTLDMFIIKVWDKRFNTAQNLKLLTK